MSLTPGLAWFGLECIGPVDERVLGVFLTCWDRRGACEGAAVASVVCVLCIACMCAHWCQFHLHGVCSILIGVHCVLRVRCCVSVVVVAVCVVVAFVGFCLRSETSPIKCNMYLN